MASDTKVPLHKPDYTITVYDYDFETDSLYWANGSSVYVTKYNTTGKVMFACTARNSPCSECYVHRVFFRCFDVRKLKAVLKATGELSSKFPKLFDGICFESNFLR